MNRLFNRVGINKFEEEFEYEDVDVDPDMDDADYQRVLDLDSIG